MKNSLSYCAFKEGCWGLDCAPAQALYPSGSISSLASLLLLALGTCQASDQMLTRVPQEMGTAQGHFQPLPTMDGRLMWGGWFWKEAGPSLLLQGTQERSV